VLFVVCSTTHSDVFPDHEYENKPLPRTCRAPITPFERQTSHQTGMDDHRVDYG